MSRWLRNSIRPCWHCGHSDLKHGHYRCAWRGCKCAKYKRTPFLVRLFMGG